MPLCRIVGFPQCLILFSRNIPQCLIRGSGLNPQKKERCTKKGEIAATLIAFALHLHCICIAFALHLHCICIAFALHLHCICCLFDRLPWTQIRARNTRRDQRHETHAQRRERDARTFIVLYGNLVDNFGHESDVMSLQDPFTSRP